MMDFMNRIERTLIDGSLLRSFLTIAECGNLTVAAERLGRTQSAVSVQIRKLESGLGATLFKRTPKGMILTAAGETLLPRARSIVSEIQSTGSLFAAPLTGTITVGLPDDFDDLVLEQALVGFARAHPGVHVEAVSGCTSGFAIAIRDGTLDIAVCSGPSNEDGETLCIEETVWAAKTDIEFDLSDPIPLAVLERSCWWRDLPTRVLSAKGRDYRIAFRSSSFAGLRAAIRAGFAVGVLPASCTDGNVTRLSGKHDLPELPCSRRSILTAAGAPKDLTSAMAAAIRDARLRQIVPKTRDRTAPV